MNLKIKIPFLQTFDDYHEISYFAELLNEIQNEKVKSCEPFKGLDSTGKYIGCFYVGTKPNKSELESLLKKHDLKLADDIVSENVKSSDRIFSFEKFNRS